MIATTSWRIVRPAKALSSMLRCVGTSWRCADNSSSVLEESVLSAMPWAFRDPGGWVQDRSSVPSRVDWHQRDCAPGHRIHSLEFYPALRARLNDGTLRLDLKPLGWPLAVEFEIDKLD